MKYIISGTDRPGSNSLKISNIIKALYKDNNEEVEIINLETLALNELNGTNYGGNVKGVVKATIEKINNSEGLIIVCPEYNGSMPGALKYFIDFWTYPDSFESRPVSFVGLGGRWGALRPIEHLQGVFGYRNAYIFPERVFISNVWNIIKDDQITDKEVVSLLTKQVIGFQKFTKALIGAGLFSCGNN